MPRRVLAALAALVAVTAVLAPTSGAGSAAGPLPVATTQVGGLAAAAPPSGPDDTVVDNPFIPDDRNLSECVSAVPKPGCGSEARGGWRQWLVFAVVLAGLAVVGWQITRAVRRNRRLQEGQDEHVDTSPGRRGP